MNKKTEIMEKVVEETFVPKAIKKEYVIGLVTKSSIVYDDNGSSNFISREGYEDLVIGDILKI